MSTVCTIHKQKYTLVFAKLIYLVKIATLTIIVWACEQNCFYVFVFFYTIFDLLQSDGQKSAVIHFVVDNNGIFAHFGIRTIPHYFLISPEGKIIATDIGYSKGSLLEFVKKTIAEHNKQK